MVTQHKPSPMIVYQKYPLNSAPMPEFLRRSFITPQHDFFVRTHGTIPTVDPATYRFSINGLVETPTSFSLDELRQNFPVTTVVSTLQCAGSRRDELSTFRQIPGEVLWGGDAISTAIWKGVLLRDVLATVNVNAEAQHIAFLGLDEVARLGKTFGFGGSIPLEKALNSEVLLAFEMNGEPLAPIHGFPLRVIVPGYIGARSVKWLARITLQETPSANYFQAHAYKLFPPHVNAETVDWQGGEMLSELPLNSFICSPADGVHLQAGEVQVQGYAVSSGECAIEGVEVSSDGGTTWIQANLQERSYPWAWCFWEATVTLTPGAHQLIVRAWDSLGRSQPEDMGEIWNFKGYNNNAWHRITISIVP